jgi:hypothetical protein
VHVRQHGTKQSRLSSRSDRHDGYSEALVEKAAAGWADAQTADAVSPDTPNVLQTMMQVEPTKLA